jgi:hypothetical protein
MPVEELVQEATQRLQAFGFQPLDEGGGERHGAFEWMWVKLRGEKGHSYVSLSDSETAGGVHRIQVWAGADNGVRFGRYLVREFSSSLDGNRDVIVESLEEAARRATALPDVTLTETYLRPPQ